MLLDPLEHEIAELLADAGKRARSSRFMAPDRDFSADLRDRLLSAADREGAAQRGHESRVRVAWSLPSLFRVPRLVPLAAAALLLIAGVVAARELYVAIGNRQDATPTPAPSVSIVVPPGSVNESAAAETVAASGVATPAHLEPTAKPTPVPAPAHRGHDADRHRLRWRSRA